MTSLTITKKPCPDWLAAFWKEIDEQSFGNGFNCLAEDATCHLGVAVWRGREEIRENLRAFLHTGFTMLHEVTEYWDGGSLKVFHGFNTMTPNDRRQPAIRPIMTHFFYMDELNYGLVKNWIGSVGPRAF